MEMFVGLPCTLISLIPVVGQILAIPAIACGLMAIYLWISGKGISLSEVIGLKSPTSISGKALAKQAASKFGLITLVIPAALILRIYIMNKLS